MLYMALVLMGWINIYAAGYDELLSNNIFDFSVALTNAQRQMLFMAASIILIVGIIVVDMRFFEAVAYVLYGLFMFLLLLVPLIGKEVGGNKSW